MTYTIPSSRSRLTTPLADAESSDEQYATLPSSAPHKSANSSPTGAQFTAGQISQFAVLKKLMRENGLLEKQPVYYAFKILLNFVLLAAGIAVLLLVHVLWVQLLDAVYLAFVFTQLGLLGHDAGHRQIFRKTWKNDALGLITGNFCLGLSNAWWLDKHNKHHSHPNQSGMDPDINIPILSFTAEDAKRKSKFFGFVVKRQAYFFFPLLLLVVIDMQRVGIRFLLKHKGKYRATEAALLVAHYICYFGVVFLSLGIWQAVVFMLIHQCLTGLYLGSIFAPNHKGMPVLEKETSLDFLTRQVITARNVKSHPITDFWYGGLNYQIEHHLFPSIPRNRLRAAQPIIREFCEAHGISYYETGVFRSYREILSYLNHVSLSLRRPARTIA